MPNHTNQLYSKFILTLLLIIIVAFALFQPKLSVWLFPFKRQMIANNFISQVNKTHVIDARDFWQFREFYYPGYFTFERDGLSKAQAEQGLEQTGAKLQSTTTYFPFLVYTADKFHSIDFLTNATILDEAVRLSTDSQKVILKTNTSIIYYDTPNSLIIIFVKPTSEMVTANGYYNYRNEDDVAIYTGKNWLSISRVILN